MQPLLEPQGAPSNPWATSPEMAGGVSAAAFAQPKRCIARAPHKNAASCSGYANADSESGFNLNPKKLQG